ncbi:MAG: DsbE family thiol:disulfide interchange protein [Steroidobacteraceae bacterium]|jgi:cytochrome c biogenesis protein CcmG/thiol:disulfide interchange protein DsbE|nr:DsbE family thiol:disulfide interchange protein [Steroidobacteraceae bacterium]
MTRSLKSLVPAAIFVVLVGFLFVGLFRDPSKIPSPLVGKPAPDFTLEGLRDPSQVISNESLAGRMYLLNVWNSSCVTCRQEHPMLMQIARSSGLPIVGLNWKEVDWPEDPEVGRVRAIDWLTRFGDPYELVAYDKEGSVGINFGVYGTPETFLVSADGMILAKRVGAMTPEAWEQEFLPLIARGQGGS